jgi:uncharacterized HAD superfamily protein
LLLLLLSVIVTFINTKSETVIAITIVITGTVSKIESITNSNSDLFFLIKKNEMVIAISVAIPVTVSNIEYITNSKILRRSNIE